MNEASSILKDIRRSVGLAEDSVDFDTDLVMLINASLGILHQNGIGLPLMVVDELDTWGDFKNPDQVEGNVFFQLVPLFVQLNTKILFDPPPPSAVQHFSTTIDQLLYRLKAAYEEPLVNTTVSSEEW